MFEAAVALPLLLLFLMGFADFVRIFSAKTILDRANTEALEACSTYPGMDFNIAGLPANDPVYLKFVQTREACFQAASRVAVGALISDPSTPSTSQLLSGEIDDSQVAPDALGNTPRYDVPGLILRPGEHGTLGGKTYTHSSYPAATGISQRELQKRHPLVGVLAADIKPILPFLGSTLRIESVKEQYRTPDPWVVEQQVRDDANGGGSVGGGSSSSSSSSSGLSSSSSSSSSSAWNCNYNAAWDWCLRQSRTSTILVPQCPINSLPPASNVACQCGDCKVAGL